MELLTDPTIALRLSLALVLSLAFGCVRQFLGKPIGFGAFTLVALGACGLSLVAVSLNPENPLPLLSAIVTGIGFLGAGALFRSADRVSGFTSAAMIWIFAVFGLTTGVGEYLAAGFTYAAIWLVFLIDRWLERHWLGSYERKLEVEVALDAGDTLLEQQLGLPPRAEAASMRLDRSSGRLVIGYSIRRHRAQEQALAERLAADPAVLAYRLE